MVEKVERHFGEEPMKFQHGHGSWKSKEEHDRRGLYPSQKTTLSTRSTESWTINHVSQTPSLLPTLDL